MRTSDATACHDLFIVPQFFQPRLCETILAEMKSLEGSAATVYGLTTSGSIDQNVRKTLRVKPSDETIRVGDAAVVVV